MKICVINGSPRGEHSVTMQYVYYLQKVYPDNAWSFIHASKFCAGFESDEKKLDEELLKVTQADLVIWGFPLYYLLVHSQMKRFIELIFEKKKEGLFKEKYTFALSTSIHFYDYTAHEYIHAICDDLEMNYIDSFSAKMTDLTDKQMRRNLELFFEKAVRAVKSGVNMKRAFAPLVYRQESVIADNPGEGQMDSGPVLVICDNSDPESAVFKMARTFSAYYKEKEIVYLDTLNFRPCLGCYKCGPDNVCCYDNAQKDEFLSFYNNKVLKSGMIVFALTMKDRYFSHLWQRYLERNFVRTHQPVYAEKKAVFLVEGPLSQNQNARLILQGWAEVNHLDVVDLVSDEEKNPSALNGQLAHAAGELDMAFATKSRKPVTFLGVGGFKVFRDEIYGGLKFLFQADHSYYKKKKLYDFPQRDFFKLLGVSLLLLILKVPPIRRQFRNRAGRQMLRPFKSILQKAVPKVK